MQADATGKPDPALPLNAKTRTDHSARAFLGYKRAFNADVAFSTGIEYLQSFVDTDISKKDSRLNFDATLTAKLMEGFSLGVGFQARYSKDPLPGKEQLDTSTTLSIIYGWNDIKPPKKEEEAAKCPACPEPPPCPAQTAPAAPATPSPASTPAPAAAQPAAATPSAPATQPAVTTSAPATPAAPITTPAPK